MNGAVLSVNSTTARAERLEAALRPFAAFASGNAYINNPTTPDHGAPANTPHNVGKYRRALAEMEKK